MEFSRLDTSSTADELAQFIYCYRWMSVCILDFIQVFAPLNEILEDRAKLGRR